MTCKTLRSLALVSGVLLSSRYAAAQFASADAARRRATTPSEEDSRYAACLQRRACADRDEACVRACGIEAMAFRSGQTGEILPAARVSAVASHGTAVPKIIYTSDKGRMFKKWREARLRLQFAESAVGSAEGVLRDETALEARRARRAELCGRLRQNEKALTDEFAAPGSGDKIECAKPDSEPAEYPVSRLNDDLARARVEKDAAARAFSRVEADLRTNFPDLTDSIQRHREDVSEFTVLQEGADFYYETYCNGRCPS